MRPAVVPVLRWTILLFAVFLLNGPAAHSVTGDVDGDGDIDRNDIDLIVAGRNTPASDSADPRDLDGDGVITVLDARQASALCTRPACATEPAQLEVDVSPAEATILVGASINATTGVTYTTTDSTPRSITIVQTITPPTGLTISPGITPGFTQSATFTNVDAQTLTATQPGTYQIQTTASIPAIGLTRSAVQTVTVVETVDPVIVHTPAAEPSALPPNAVSLVLTSVQVDGIDPLAPPLVRLQGVNFVLDLPMQDDGVDPDAAAGDGIFTATASLDSTGLPIGGCRTVRAVAGTQQGAPLDLCVTGLPIGVALSDMTDPLVDPATNLSVVRDEVIVTFRPGVTETRMQEIAAGVNGTIVGTLPGTGAGSVVQIRLNTPPATFGALTAILTALRALPEVAAADANGIGSSSAVTPTDPRFPTQYALTRVRADEAWVIARGSAMIAVLDTGVDYLHPDLFGRVVRGRDFANNDLDPRDDHGHGTHVAGIAAAHTNNGVGISGASWHSAILAVKMLAANGNGSDANLSAAVAHAVARGARILNLSLQNFGAGVCAAITTARVTNGRLVVSAAGNNASSALNYPGACASSLAVGNTTATDGRSPSSNFGAWVDLAAPGHLIISTMPTYNVTMNNPPFNVAMNYGTMTGTSMAAPLVAGAAAVVLSRRPALTATQVADRLRRTAVQLPPGLQLGAGRIDLFEAVFDASFEDANLPMWTRVGTSTSVTALGPLRPQHPNYPAAFPRRPRMAYVSTGPAGDQVAGSLTQAFTVQPGVPNIPMRLTFTFVSEEFPEFVGTVFDDAIRITLLRPNGTTVTLAERRVNTAAFVPIFGINFPGGDATTGWTTWQTIFMNVPITAGPGSYRIFITDAGDDIYDSVVLVDNITFK